MQLLLMIGLTMSIACLIGIFIPHIVTLSNLAYMRLSGISGKDYHMHIILLAQIGTSGLHVYVVILSAAMMLVFPGKHKGKRKRK
jgi:hypothetical protein